MFNVSLLLIAPSNERSVYCFIPKKVRLINEIIHKVTKESEATLPMGFNCFTTIFNPSNSMKNEGIPIKKKAKR